MPKISQLPPGGVIVPTDIIPFTRAGATYEGSVAPSFVDPKTYGAANNGINDDATALQSALTQAHTINNSTLIGNNSVSKTINWPGVTTIPGGLITSTIVVDNPTVSLTGSNNIITGLTLSVPNATAVQMNTANANNNIILGSIIVANGGYAILHNDAVSNGFIVMGSYVESGGADAIEINHPTHPAANVVLIGNVLSADGTTVSGSAGFAIGIAQANTWIAMGNAIKASRQAAFHIEDLNTQGIVVGNACNACNLEGLTIQVPVPGKGFPKPLVGGFNQFKYTGSSPSVTGIRTIGDGNGNVDQITLLGNCVDGFATGYNAADTTNAYYEGSMALNCTTVAFGVKHARIFGRISAKNCTNLFQGQSGSVCDPIYSLTLPTTILTKSGGNLPGPVLRGWGYPVTVVTTGTGSAELFTIAPMPSLFFGKIFIRVEGGGAAVCYVGNIKWDGSSLTVSTPDINFVNSPISVFTIATGGGNLQASITCASGFTNVLRIEFEGFWVQNS